MKVFYILFFRAHMTRVHISLLVADAGLLLHTRCTPIVTYLQRTAGSVCTHVLPILHSAGALCVVARHPVTQQSKTGAFVV